MEVDSATSRTTRQKTLLNDPMGYFDDANLYEFVLDNPVDQVDPMGLFTADGHGIATTNGLQERDVPSDVINFIATADKNQDSGFYHNTPPFSIAANHGDNGRKGIADALELMNSRWNTISSFGGEGTCLTCDELRLALEEFGKILHTIQDLYAHSNYIELMNERMDDSADVSAENTIPLWPMSPGSTEIPDGVFTGNYVYHKPWQADPSPAPTHDLMAKDYANSAAGSEVNRNGSSMYNLALDAATRATSAAWDQLAQMIPDLMSRIMICEENGTFDPPKEYLQNTK